MHEILTLQLGHRANHLATHFWNTQESYFSAFPTSATSPSNEAPAPSATPPPSSLVDHDIHWREGISAVGGEDTYTPRTLIYDLKGGFGGLRGWGAAGDVGADDGRNGAWDGNVTLVKQPPIPPSEYQLGLESGLAIPPRPRLDTVRYWSDYNRVLYHPRSMVQIYDYELGSSLLPFERWESGEELFASLDREVDVLDRDLRVWAEECDALQGIQVVAGTDDAWGGFAARYVERIRDEFGKIGVWVWGVEEERGRDVKVKQMLRTVNAAKSMYEVSMQASMYIPLSIPSLRLPSYLDLDRGSIWHTSALLSMALESITLPSRLRPDGGKRGLLDDMEAALNVNGNQRIGKVQMSLPDPLVPKGQQRVAGETEDDRTRGPNTEGLFHEDAFLASAASLDMDFFYGAAPTSRGFHAHSEKKDHVFGQVEIMRGNTGPTHEQDDGHADGNTRKRRRYASLPILEKYRTSLQFPILNSFPDIFAHRSDFSQSIGVHAALSTTSKVLPRIKELRGVVSIMVGLAEREALLNGLGEIGEGYTGGWESGSDDDSDD